MQWQAGAARFLTPCAVIGAGSYLPSRVVTNEEAGQLARIEPKRIERLFNIHRRHWTRGVHNIERVGNTISASILILLDELSREGQIAAGDRLLLVTAESSTWSYGGMSIVW